MLFSLGVELRVCEPATLSLSLSLSLCEDDGEARWESRATLVRLVCAEAGCDTTRNPPVISLSLARGA